MVNSQGLLHVIYEVQGGIRGQVLDSETYEAIDSVSLSKDHDDNMFSMTWFTTSQGEFWRPWRPGKYNLKVRFVATSLFILYKNFFVKVTNYVFLLIKI